MSASQGFIELIVTIVTFFFTAFFVACEFSLVQTRVSELEEERDQSKHTPKKLQRELYMLSHLNDYLSTTQVGVSLGGIIMGWIGESLIVEVLVDVFKVSDLHINSALTHTISAIIGVTLLTYLEVVLTEITPKNLSIAKPRTILSKVSLPLHYFHTIFYPFVWLLNISAAQVVKLFGVRMTNENNETLSQSEILNVSKNAVKSGELEQNDYLYMERAFEFNDKVARDIMIDRTQLEVIDINATVKEAINKYLNSKFSRLPVVRNNNKDNIFGYVYNYDLIRQSQVDSNVKMDKMLRDITTTSETTHIKNVLQQMINNRTPIVVVVDEYGGTSGIITDKDIYEELFGTVRDEIDPSFNEFIFKQPKGTYQINGKLNTYDFERFFNTEIPDFDRSDIVTMAGYVIDNYPNLKNGSTFRLGDFKFKVLDYRHSFINWFEVSPINSDNDNQDSNSKEQNTKNK